MRVETYDPDTMTLLDSNATIVDFGTVARGHFNEHAVVIRPAAVSETFSQLALFLENNGGLDHTKFGKFKSATPILGIEPGDSFLSDFFTQARGVSDFANYAVISDYGIGFDPVTPEYAWMDAEAGTSELNLGNVTINLRFVFEYV